MKVFNYLFFVAMIFGATACGSDTSTNDTTEETSEVAEYKTKVIGEEVKYSTDDTDMIGFIAYDHNSEEKRPGILVVHEWWGHNDYVRERARMLAEMGYVALAVDMYGNGQQATHPDDAGKFAMSVMQNFPTAEARFNAALEVLKNHPQVASEDLGAIGYCFGGGVVLSMANTGVDLDGIASFHGSLGLPVMPEKGKTTARILVLNGAADPFVTPEQIAAYTAAMDEAEADYKLINYEGAVHAFTSKGADEYGKKFELPLAYNKEADQKSWEEMKTMFAQVFSK
jgi:dienelactone hydrolase